MGVVFELEGGWLVVASCAFLFVDSSSTASSKSLYDHNEPVSYSTEVDGSGVVLVVDELSGLGIEFT